MASELTPIIEAKNLFIDYKLERGWVNALYDVSLTIHPLEIHGLVGESGSGKSTLALALMRYLAANSRISAGSIALDEDDLVGKSTADMRKIWGRQISLVPQDSLASLNPAYPIGDQIAEITQRHEGLSRQEALTQAVDMLGRVKIADPADVAKRYPHQLSGGMQQRVTIAMALSTHPRLLILDEPTTSLDVTTQAVILDLFRELIRDNEAAALYVSHDLGLVAQLCDRVTVLYGGEVMASAPTIELFKRPLHPYTISLLASMPRPTEGTETRLSTIEGVAPSLAERPHACVFADRCPAALDICREVKPALEITDDGQLIKCHRWREIADGSLVIDTTPQEKNIPAPPRENLVLNVSHLEKHFGKRTLVQRLMGKPAEVVHAVDDISFHIRERSTLGLVGESGSGKTTLARCIVALESADSGDLSLLNIPLSLDLHARPQSSLRDLQMVFQNPNDTLNPYMSIGDTLGRTIKRLDGTLNREQTRARVIDLLNAVRLTSEYATRYPSELSGGEKQRVAIARAFAANPALVLADEPTSSLDVSVQAVILNLLKDLRAQQGASYLFISHDLRAVSYLADWIVVLYLGEIAEVGTSHDVYNVPSHPYTEALVSAISVPDPTADQKRIRLTGDIPSARHLPTGCRFHTRCPRKIGTICEVEAPPWRDAGDGHFIRCHIPIDELRLLQQTAPPPRQTSESTASHA